MQVTQELKENNTVKGTSTPRAFFCFLIPLGVSGNPSSKVTRGPFARTWFISKRPASLRLMSWMAYTQQRQMLLQHAPPLGTPPSCPMQQYITATLPDLHQKKLNTPAPYMRTCSQIPTLLLRARCQNLTHLRNNLYDKTDTSLSYRRNPCMCCNPTALLDQGPLLIHTHHPVDNIHHLATSCVTMRDQREQLGHQLEGIMVELGIRPQECAKVSEENKTSLTLASDPTDE